MTSGAQPLLTAFTPAPHNDKWCATIVNTAFTSAPHNDKEGVGCVYTHLKLFSLAHLEKRRMFIKRGQEGKRTGILFNKKLNDI